MHWADWVRQHEAWDVRYSPVRLRIVCACGEAAEVSAPPGMSDEDAMRTYFVGWRLGGNGVKNACPKCA
jgi:rRNA maturation protein Nop10